MKCVICLVASEARPNNEYVNVSQSQNDICTGISCPFRCGDRMNEKIGRKRKK